MSNEIKKCRLCNSKKLALILNLKDQPPANSIHSNIKKPKKFPLKIRIIQFLIWKVLIFQK